MTKSEAPSKQKSAQTEQDYERLRSEMLEINKQKTGIDLKTLNTGIGVPAVNTYTNVSKACSIQ